MRPVPPIAESIGHSPKRSWEVIEHPDAVQAVDDRVRRAARFDVYRRPDLYDLAYPGYPGDADYYLRAGRSGAVLYLGVGTGRIFVPLASANPGAVGLDVSTDMVGRVTRAHPTVRGRILRADAASADLGADRFDAVLAPYSFLQCLDETSVPRVVRNAHRWLRPGGVFLTDTFSPYLIPFATVGLEASIRECGDDTRVAIYIRYDHLHQRMTEYAVVERAGAPDCVLRMDLHYYFPRQVHAFLVEAGFEPPRVCGGYREEAFDPGGNEVLVYEARKPAA